MPIQELEDCTACLSIDVEWAHPEVLEDILTLLRERSLRATLFCTHPGIPTGPHERGIHPNFRRGGDVGKKVLAELEERHQSANEPEYLRQVLVNTLAFAPEAIGSRSHSLYYDSQLMPIYADLGLKYDSSYFMPLCSWIRPFLKEYGVIELPIYYNDFFELRTGAIGMDAARVDLNTSGLRVFNFHPNLIYTNCPSLEHYEASRKNYSRPEELRRMRHAGRGARDFFVGLLDRLIAEKVSVVTLAEVEGRVRSDVLIREKTLGISAYA